MIVKGLQGEYYVGGIYKHYKGNYYMIDNVAFLHDSQAIFLIIYHQCDANGIYISIRDEQGNPKVHQPFATHESRWLDMVHNQDHKQVPRFELIKPN
jgi:hypothetical protein